MNMKNSLTKEYVQDFGWEYINGFYYEFPVKNTIMIEEYSNRALDFRLNFVDFGRYLMLEAYERNGFMWETCFRGKCKTEGAFEVIMKQFNIDRIQK